ncbi:copper chaperone PCu(A)C [Streptomyces sp. NPDC088707]|uniref:copper chaperone PCu(A)C n=1 Tax=Streptomyces sp. NPDC088707 TaxID=3365871 RepID=UPI0037F538C7
MKMPVSTYVTTVPETTWLRWLPNSLPAAGYTTLKNSSEEPIEIAKIKSPDYKNVRIYETVVDSESSKMVKVDKVTIPAKGNFAMVPGRYHLMLENPIHVITPGDSAMVIFFLSTGRVLKLRMPVRTSPELS